MSSSLWPPHSLGSFNAASNSNYIRGSSIAPINSGYYANQPSHLFSQQFINHASANNFYPSSGSSYLNLASAALNSAPITSNSIQASASFNNLPTGPGRYLPANLPDNLNQDPNPLVIRKKSQPVNYNQQIGVRFIKPEPLPPHGDIVVKHLPDQHMPPPPPHYIRNVPQAPFEPPPRIIREAPPAPPPRLPDEVVTIPGRRIQAPRKIIIENYAEVPQPRTECRVVYDTPHLLVHPNEAICF